MRQASFWLIKHFINLTYFMGWECKYVLFSLLALVFLAKNAVQKLIYSVKTLDGV